MSQVVYDSVALMARLGVTQNLQTLWRFKVNYEQKLKNKMALTLADLLALIEHAVSTASHIDVNDFVTFSDICKNEPAFTGLSPRFKGSLGRLFHEHHERFGYFLSSTTTSSNLYIKLA